MTALFVTATGTGVGKTLLTEILIRQCRAAGRKVDALKPVISGYDPEAPEESDTGRILAALGCAPDATAVAAISPWRFRAPLSPDMAAAREGQTIEFDDLVAWCRARIARRRGVLLIEGVGGAMVPLDARRTVRDWMAALDVPALVLSGSYLGAMSHTLTTLEALAAARVAVAALVVSESEDSPVPPEETVATLRRFAAVPVRILPRLDRMAAPPLLDLLDAAAHRHCPTTPRVR